MELEGKVAVVTGSSRGIGAEVARTLAGRGAAVVVNYVKGAGEADGVVKEIEAKGGRAVPVRADVSDRRQAQRLVDRAVGEFGRLDVLVNNAGILTVGTVLDTEEPVWDRTMAVNLKGPFNCMQIAARVMVKQGSGGKIINVSSVNGLGMAASKDEIAYSTSKAALIAMSQLAAAELGPYGICVNAIAPGFIMTDMAVQSAGSRRKLVQLKKRKAALAALGRTGDPKDIADVALFLASDASRFVTGQVIVVDGLRRDFFSHG